MGFYDPAYRKSCKHNRKRARKHAKAPAKRSSVPVLQTRTEIINGQTVTVKVLPPRAAEGAHPGQMTKFWRQGKNPGRSNSSNVSVGSAQGGGTRLEDRP